MIKIGHAVANENGKATGGKPGDQTGRELRIQDWYDREKGWSSVIRPKSSDDAEKIAQACYDGVENQAIGYAQDHRTTLYDEAKKVDFDLKKVETPCECDCSSFVSVCVNAAGIKVSKDIWTGNELEALKATGRFKVYTAKSYTASPDKLKRGDILLGEGHTAIVLGEEIKNVTHDNSQSTEKQAGNPVKPSAHVQLWRCQIAACRNEYAARSIAAESITKGLAASIIDEDGWHKVISGWYETQEGALKRAKACQAAGFETYVYQEKRR